MKTLLKYAFPLGVIAVVVILVLIGYKSCNLYDQNSELKGRITVLTTELHQSEEATAKIREAFAKVVIEKDLDIAKWKAKADANAGGMAEGDTIIADLKKQIVKLNPAEKDAKILKQAELITQLEKNLTLAYSTIDSKDHIIVDLQSKYDTCVIYYTQLEKDINLYKGLAATKDSLITGLEHNLKVARFWGNTTKITTLAAGIALVVMIIAK